MSLYAVIVEHLAENCPLAQATPEAARTLAGNLDVADATGVFSMKLHHGVALVEAGSADDLAEAFGAALPHHELPVVVDVTGDELLEGVVANPAELDDNEALRLDVLDAVAEHFDGFDLRATRQQGLPTNSLRRLPAYLRDNAPGQAAA